MADDINTNDLSNSLAVRETMAGYEAFNKTPEAIAAQRDLAADKARQQETYTAYQDQLASRQKMLDANVTRQQEYQQQLANVPPLADQSTFFRQTTPMMMMIAAVGGIVGRKSAMAGMQAMNGMLEGQMQGDQAKYEAAKTKWTDSIAAIEREKKAADAVFDAMDKASEGQIDARRIANEAAATAVGADQKLIGDMRRDWRDMYDKVITANKAHAEKMAAGSAFGKMVGGDYLKQRPLVQQAVSSAHQYQERVTALTTAYDNLEKAIQANPQIERDIKAASIKPEILTSLVKQNPAVAAFVQAAQKLTPSAMAQLNQGLSAGAIRAAGVRFANMEMEALPSIKGGMEMLRAAMPGIKTDAEEVQRLAQEKWTNLESERKAIESGDTTSYFRTPAVADPSSMGSPNIKNWNDL